MKLSKFLEDLAIISKLGDNPGADNGLTADGLKAKFDEGVLKLQTFINTEIIDKINSYLLLDGPLQPGANMTGPINMNGQAITGLGSPTANDQASNKGYVDTAKKNAVEESETYTNAAAKKAAPPNLLDNSDFRNPVNQGGLTLYEGAGYGIDRWICSSGNWNVAVEDGYIRFYSDNLSTTSMFTQCVPITPSIRGKTVTFAARVKGDYVRLNINGSTGSYNRDNSKWVTLVKTAVVPTEGDFLPVSLQNNKLENTEGFLCEWAALYEGEYTAETLPEYRPKGYGAELAECQRYFLADVGKCCSGYITPDGSLEIFVPTPVKMRITPSVAEIALDNAVTYVDGKSVIIACKSASVHKDTANGVRVRIETELAEGTYRYMPIVTFATQFHLSANF